MSVYDAAVGGDQRAVLEALRDKLAKRVDDEETPVGVLPAMAKQLADVVTRLAELPEAKKGSTVDDLATRRADRRRQAASS